MVDQGDRSCAKARRAFAEKFGLGTNNTWYVLHNTQLNVQICKYVQKQSICRKNSKHAKVFMVIFALAEMLPISATL